MKLIIILGILAVAYLVYRSLTAPDQPAATVVDETAVEEVVIPDSTFKNGLGIAGGIAVLILVLIAAAFLL